MVKIADRVVKVTIQASIANYVSGMEKVRKATADAANQSEKLEKLGQASTSVGTALLSVGAIATGAAAVVVKMAADFDAQMSKVQAATGATAAEMSKFREQALTAGAAFGYTATQVTEAQVELGKAGLATKDILGGGLDGVLALAASDNVELGKATQIAAVAMKQFGLAGKDVPHIADELAAGAGKALGGVEQLGDALNQSGLVASNFGFSLEETTGLLSSFADAGLLGSDAGTSLKTMLQALANPSKQSAEQMKQLGINVQDANGNFLGAADLAQLLHDKLGDLSNAQRQQALSQIFGSDAVRAATVLYKEGADGIQKYIDQNNDAGYAMEQAALKSDNLNGDLKKLKSAFQSGLIETGTAANSALRPLVQTMTSVVTAFNQLPEPLKGVALGVTGVVGGVSLLAGGLLIAIPKIVEFRAAVATLGEGGVTARSSLNGVVKFLTGPWGIALSVAAAAAALFAAQQLQSAQYTQTLRDSLDDTTGALTRNTTELVSNALAARTTIFGAEISGSSAYDKAKRLGVGLDTVTKAAQGNTRAYKQLLAVQRDIRGSDDNDYISKKYGEGLSDASGDITELVQSVDKQRSALKNAKGQQEQLNEAQSKGKGTAEDAASGLDSIAQSAEDATQAISDTANAIKGFNSGQLDVNSTQRDFEAAIDAVTDSVKENGQSLDVTSEKGRQNAAALDSIAQSTLNYAGALFQQTGSQDQATSALNSGRDSLVAALGQYGVTGQAAQDYADKILGTPTSWATLFQADTGNAGSQVDGLHRKIDDVPAKKVSKLLADQADAVAKVANVKARLNEIPPNKQTAIRAEIADAEAKLNRIRVALAGVQSKTVRITTEEVRVGNSMTGTVATKATGGYIAGPGTGTSDDIPAMLSNGEYVIRAASVQRYGRNTFDRMNAGHYANGGMVQRFANGGGVQYQYDKFAGNYSGLQAVSQLISMYNDTGLSVSLRNQSGLAALSFQRSLTNLSDKSDSAAKKLSDLRSSADSLRTSVSSAVSKFDVGGYRSAGGLKSGLARSAGSAKEFADLLKKLASKGVRGDLLAEIASLGTAEGLPLARSLAAATAGDIKSINSSYASIQSSAGKAGQTVADANFKAQIAAADKNARSLESQIAKQSVAIQKIIARGFGVKGYASGGYTGDYGVGDVAGVVHGREFVMTAAATARNRSMLEAMNAGRDVRYMDPTPVRGASSQPAQVINRAGNNYNLSVQDPTAVAQAIERRERASYA